MSDRKNDHYLDEVGIKFKIIVSSLAIMLNGIVFVWYFSLSGLK